MPQEIEEFGSKNSKTERDEGNLETPTDPEEPAKESSSDVHALTARIEELSHGQQETERALREARTQLGLPPLEVDPPSVLETRETIAALELKLASIKERKENAEFTQVIDQGIERALSQIADRFERSSVPRDNLAFHNQTHTKDVIRRTDAILKTIQNADPALVKDRDRLLGKLAAAFHDTVQNYTEAQVDEKAGDKTYKKIFRKREIGLNETKSIAEGASFINAINQERTTSGNQPIFTEQDRTTLNAIDVTVPGFDPEKGVFQPNLKKESPPVTRALALADIGTAGFDGPVKFLPECNALFREENFDIAEASAHPETISEEDKNRFRERMLKWSAFQIKFVAGRKNLFESEIAGLSTTAQKAVREIFTKFDDSMKASEEKSARRQTMTFEALLEDMGFRKTASTS